MSKTICLQHATHKKEADMTRFANVKTGVKLLQDRVLVSLLSGIIALVGAVGFAAAKKAPGALSS
jgi:hypothetical protein